MASAAGQSMVQREMAIADGLVLVQKQYPAGLQMDRHGTWRLALLPGPPRYVHGQLATWVSHPHAAPVGVHPENEVHTSA